MNVRRPDGALLRQHHRRSVDFRSLPDEQKQLFVKAKKVLRLCGYNGDCYAFGSRTHGTFTDSSDIDVMVPSMNASDFNALHAAVGSHTVEGHAIDLQTGRVLRLQEVWRICDTVSK